APYFPLGLNSMAHGSSVRRLGDELSSSVAAKLQSSLPGMKAPTATLPSCSSQKAWSSRSGATSAARPSHAPRYLRTIRDQPDHAQWRLVQGETDSLRCRCFRALPPRLLLPQRLNSHDTGPQFARE